VSILGLYVSLWFKVTTFSFGGFVRIYEFYESAKRHCSSYHGSADIRGQSRDFDLEYLEKYVKVKVNVKLFV
jgi:hypothetical protein